jgi:hypothetical protein
MIFIKTQRSNHNNRLLKIQITMFSKMMLQLPLIPLIPIITIIAHIAATAPVPHSSSIQEALDTRNNKVSKTLSLKACLPIEEAPPTRSPSGKRKKK